MGGASASSDVLTAAAAATTEIQEEHDESERQEIVGLEMVPEQETCMERYASLARRDRKAWQFRASRARDPFRRENLVRRVTWGVKDGKVLADEWLADLPAEQSSSS
eukprot:2948767-Amphidinium_carterae.1